MNSRFLFIIFTFALIVDTLMKHKDLTIKMSTQNEQKLSDLAKGLQFKKKKYTKKQMAACSALLYSHICYVR